ncbi:MAG TPA: hypothetical protein VGI70_12070 [Polyangiales bacterium]
MNFFAHAKLALWRSTDPRFVFGAMLPDLSSMIGVRIKHVDQPELAAGVGFHYATDAAFHAAPSFVAICSNGLATLSEAGVARGTARAVVHVGTELLLDGVLADDLSALHAYRRALASATAERWVKHFELESAQDPQSFHEALERLARAPVPESYRDPGFVSARLRTILGRRPRLAMRESDREGVERFVERLQSDVLAAAPALLDQVRTNLDAAQLERRAVQ